MRRQLLTATILTLLLLIGIASAAFAYSFTYDKFNTSTPTYVQTDKARKTWQAKITNNLVYTTAYTGVAKIKLTNGTTTYKGLDIAFVKGGLIEIYEVTSTTWALLANKSGGWAAGEPIYITLDSNGYLDVGNETNPYVLEDYALGTIELNYVGAYGAGVNFTAGETVANSGYITVEIDDLPISVSLDIAIEILYAVIPLVFAVAVIGVIIQMFKELSK